MTEKELTALERDPAGVAPLKECVRRLCAEVRRLRAELRQHRCGDAPPPPRDA